MNDENEKKPPEIEDGSQDKKQDSGGAALGICFGCAFGLLVQVITGEVMWLPLGVFVGSALGLAIGSIRKGRK